MRKITKLFVTKATSVDEKNKTIRFKISDNLEDRMGEIVDQSWDFKNYESNPVVFWGHESREPEYVLGTTQSLEVEEDGSATYATMKLDEDINPKASLVWKQLLRGTLRCVSVGFISNSEETNKSGVPVLKDNELLEISIVPIPANPRAVALAYKEGSLSKKDATWLLDSMRKEANFLEEQMKQDNDIKENPMNEKAITALLEAVTALAGAQADTNKRLDTLATEIKESNVTRQKGAVSDILDADHSWEAQDDKWEHMEDVSEMYYAFCEAYFYTATPVGDFNTLLKEFVELLTQVLDGTYSDADDAEGEVAKALKTADKARIKELAQSFLKQKAEAADTSKSTEEPKPADKKEDEDESEDDPKDGLAKGGSNDQPGAQTGDEIDLEAELTPELAAQVDSALETVNA